MANKLFKVTAQTRPQLVAMAKTLLQDGRVIAIPTDTVYGLAILANSTAAIDRLYRVKSRDPNKPLAICVADIGDMARYATITVPDSVLQRLLPGASTVVFRRSRHLNRFLNPQTELVAIRIPDDPFVRELCRALANGDGPLALTSANQTGQQSCLTVQEFSKLWPTLDAVFDGGPLGHIDPERLGSTIVDLSVRGHYRIIRPGCNYRPVVEALDQCDLKRLD